MTFSLLLSIRKSFSKLGLVFKERICSERSKFLRVDPILVENYFFKKLTLIEMGGNKCRVASLELLLLIVFQYDLCTVGNMLKPVPPDYAMEYKPLRLNIFLPYLQSYRQISDITSPLFLRFVNSVDHL